MANTVPYRGRDAGGYGASPGAELPNALPTACAEFTNKRHVRVVHDGWRVDESRDRTKALTDFRRKSGPVRVLLTVDYTCFESPALQRRGQQSIHACKRVHPDPAERAGQCGRLPPHAFCISASASTRSERLSSSARAVKRSAPLSANDGCHRRPWSLLVDLVAW
jgi:hypothetical protein